MKRTVILIIIAAWLLIPTGTPDDVITWYLIGKLGQNLYIITLGILLLLMWKYKINLTKIKRVMKKLWRGKLK